MAQERLKEGLAGIASRLPAALGDAAFELRTFSEVGLIRPMRPDKLARVAERYVRLGASPALGSAANAITVPDHVGDHRRGGQPDLGADAPALERARSGAARRGRG